MVLLHMNLDSWGKKSKTLVCRLTMIKWKKKSIFSSKR